jgi:hypothetical protein
VGFRERVLCVCVQPAAGRDGIIIIIIIMWQALRKAAQAQGDGGDDEAASGPITLGVGREDMERMMQLFGGPEGVEALVKSFGGQMVSGRPPT